MLLLLFIGLWGIGPVWGYPETSPIRLETVVVDAGHGGKDLGAVSARGTREKDLALEIARGVRDGLRRRGVSVVMTRDADRFIPLPLRAKVANRKRADLFVSVHLNASESKTLKGFEVYSLSEATDDHALSLERAENASLGLGGAPEPSDPELRTVLWDLKEAANRRESVRLANMIGDSALHSLPIAARRIRQANFHVLKHTQCPAVLVEVGYLSNVSDEARLRNPRYRRRLAEAIVKGILNFKEKFDRSGGFTD